MILYELSNPSDKMTFYAADRLTAAVAVWMMSTAYGATAQEPRDETQDVPIALFGDAMETIKYMSEGKTVDELLGDVEFLKKLRDAYGSFRYGDRGEYEELRGNAKDEAEFDRMWEERKRSSMNNIGAHAGSMCRKIHERIKEMKPESVSEEG